jgi:hypothetical protein
MKVVKQTVEETMSIIRVNTRNINLERIDSRRFTVRWARNLCVRPPTL